MTYFDCENIPRKALRRVFSLENESAWMKLSQKKPLSEDWRARVMTVASKKKKLTIARNQAPKRVQVWICKKYVSQQFSDKLKRCYLFQ